MDKNGFHTVIFLFLIVSECSNASLLRNFRKIFVVAPKDNSASQGILYLCICVCDCLLVLNYLLLIFCFKKKIPHCPILILVVRYQVLDQLMLTSPERRNLRIPRRQTTHQNDNCWGAWACGKFRKRGRQVGVPYQELEMGLPESASAVNVDTAEGWDQGWDEDNAVKLPGGRHVGNISANGLTSGSS